MGMNNMAPLPSHVTEQWHWPADLLQIQTQRLESSGVPHAGSHARSAVVAASRPDHVWASPNAMDVEV